VLLLVAGVHAQPVSFHGIGVPVGWPSSLGLGLSRDGLTVVGQARNSGGGTTVAITWSEAGGLVVLPGSGGGAVDASATGAVAVGWASNTAARWVGGIHQSLGTLSGGFSSAAATSGDGAVIVGSSTSGGDGRAFRWTAQTGMIDLGRLPGGGGGAGTGATDISPDGSVIVGTDFIGGVNARESTFRWTQATGMQEITAPAGFRDAIAPAISGDGLVVVGRAEFPTVAPFRWTMATGSQALPLLAGWNAGAAQATSFDGGIIGGYIRSISGSSVLDHAAVWDAGGTCLDLNALLPALGMPLGGWVLSSVTGVSGDGKTLSGYGINPLGGTEGWIATIPGPSSLAVMVLGGLAAARRSRGAQRPRRGHGLMGK
jgi:probable HAF family extracellular repeat protein